MLKNTREYSTIKSILNVTTNKVNLNNKWYCCVEKCKYYSIKLFFSFIKTWINTL